MRIGDKIRQIRELKGYSQENMADLLEVSRQAYGDIERDKVKVSLDRLEKIAEALGVSATDILSFGDRVSNFFGNSNNAVGILNGSQINNYDQRELVFTIEKQKLEIEKLKLEVEKIKLEKEKIEADFERLKHINA